MPSFAALLYSVLIAILSLIHLSAPRDIHPWLSPIDKVAHFRIYALYAIVLLMWGRRSKHGLRTRLFMTILWATFYGMLMEVIQRMLPQQMREFSWAGALANALGATAGALIAYRQQRHRHSLAG